MRSKSGRAHAPSTAKTMGASVVRERLELGTGPKRRIFEAELDGSTVRTRAGTHGVALRAAEKKLATPERAREHFDRQIAARKSKGYVVPPQKAQPVGALSRKGVVASNAEMESLVEEDPTNPQAYLVYADWLQQQGDVRGELIALHARLAKEPESEALLDAETKIFKDFRAELLGPLARYATRRLWNSYARTFDWYYGFIRSAELHHSRIGVALDSLVRSLFEHPSGRFLQRLWVTTIDPDALLKGIIGTLPRTLADLVLHDDYPQSVLNLEPKFFVQAPGLRRLEATHATIAFGKAAYPHLHELSLAGIPNAKTFTSMATAKFPSLRRLDYTYWDHEPAWVRAHDRLAATPFCGALEAISVRLRTKPEALRSLLGSSMVGRARRLEIVTSWSADQVQVVKESAPRLEHLERLVLKSHDGSRAVDDAAMVAFPPNVSWA